MMTKKEEIELKFEWLRILNEGYKKPNLDKECCRGEGTVQETKNFFEYIDYINDSLKEDFKELDIQL